MLLGCYREHGNVDPEVFNEAVLALFMDFHIDAVRTVCNPTTGIPSRLKWLPSIAELKEALTAATPAPEPPRRIEKKTEDDPETRERVGKMMRETVERMKIENGMVIPKDASYDGDKAEWEALRARANELGGDDAAWSRAMRERDHAR